MNYIPNEFKDKIRNDKILPYLEKKLEIALNTEKFWSSTTIIFWIISTILLSIAGIFAFATPYYPKLPMSFISGILIVIGTSCKDFTYFSGYIDTLKSREINNILKNIGIDFQIHDESNNVKSTISGSFQNDIEEGKYQNDIEEGKYQNDETEIKI